MKESLALAELRGYVTAKVDDYQAIVNKNEKCLVPAKEVVDDLNRILEIIIDMQGQKIEDEQIKIVFNGGLNNAYTDILEKLKSQKLQRG